MKNLMTSLTHFMNDEEGASAIEYAIILGMVAVAIITLSGSIRTKVVALFTSLDSAL